MKKLLLRFALIVMASPLVSLAAVEPSEDLPKTGSGWGSNAFTIFDRIIDGLFVVLMVAAAISIVVAAYFFLTAGGDAARVATARNYVLYALVGVIVGFLARGLVMLINWILQQGGQVPVPVP